MTEAILLLLATYFVHSTIFLLAVFCLEQSGVVRSPAARELLWRCALFAGIATATVQIGSPALESAIRSARTPVSAAVSPMPPDAAVPVGTRADPQLAVSNGAPRNIVQMTPGSVPRDGLLLSTRTAWALPAAARGLADWIATLWLLAAIVGASSLAFALIRRASAVARLAPCSDPTALRIVTDIARTSGMHPPRLVEDPASTSPTANMGGVLTLPPWALRGVDGRGLEAMLAHELGHVARRDVAWRVASAVVRSVFWFQPLNALAARRLEALAELGADSWAVSVTGNRRALAECLARCATEIGRARAPSFAIAMTGRSPLLVRIQSLLQENPMKSTHVLPVHRWLIAVALLLAIVVLPVFVIAPAVAGRGSNIESSRSIFGGHETRVRINEHNLKLSAEIRGDIRFTEAETDVVALGEGDEAWIEQEVDGVVRRVEFQQTQGKLARRYLVNERAQALDAAGRAWLRAVIPLLFREAGIDADGRAKRLYARGGANAVLDEIARIRGDHVRKVYVSALADLGPMRPIEQDRAIALAGAIRSDFERRESFVALIDHQSLGAGQQIALLTLVPKIDSDFEMRNVLEALAPKMIARAEVAAAWARALDSISSSFESREALVAVARRKSLEPVLTQFALRSIASIGSDFEARTALAAFARHLAGRPNLTADYLLATRGIASDFERREALLAILNDPPLDANAVRGVLGVVADMDSDFEKGEVMARVAASMPAETGLVALYRQIARGMGDFERGQAEKALDRFAG